MSRILEPGNGVLFMKVGTHAGESLEDIVQRKRRELQEAGQIWWGYGGSTCHPINSVQPFVKETIGSGHGIWLIMEPMQSNHFAEPKLAEEYSDDGVRWNKVPHGVHVKGSRYALVLDSLEEDHFTLDLAALRVAVGASRGRSAAEYVSGRVDKGCFVVDSAPRNGATEIKPREIGLVAALKAPYAVMLR